MDVVKNAALRKIRAGELAIGMALRQARTVDIGAIAQACGFHWLFIDMEHASFGVDGAAQICMAALGSGVAPLVRVASHQPTDATRLLDAGALGVIVPRVENAQQARQIVRACRFAPLGQRSITALQPQTGFASLPLARTMELVESETLLAVMIESHEGVESVDEIAAVEGIDVIFIGGNDLSVSFGVPGMLGEDQVRHAIQRVAEAAKRHSKALGLGGVTEEAHLAECIALGARLVMCGSDLGFLMAGARARAAQMQRIFADNPPTRNDVQ